MEQDEAEVGDILLLDEEDCEASQRGGESQPANRTQDKGARPGSLFRRKRKSGARGSRVESSPRPRKLPRGQENSVLSSGSTVTIASITPRATGNVHRSRSRGTNKNTTSKKGKEKVRDEPARKRSPSHGKRTEMIHKKKRSGGNSRISHATPPTASHSEDSDDRNTTQAAELSISHSRSNSRNIVQSTDPAPAQDEPSDNEASTSVESAFQEEQDGTKICIHCGKHFAVKSSPTTLKYHMTNACRVLVHHSEKPVFTAQRADVLLCNMIAEDCLPLRFTENPNLRAYSDYLRPGYKPPCRITLTKKVLPKVKAALEKTMKAKLNTIDFVSISFDGWTSDAVQNYIALLCHGITPNWILETFLLDVVPVNEAETAAHVAKMVRRVLKEWGIPLEAVVTAATDGAPTMQCSVAKKLKLPWVYCAAHAINRAVFLALDVNPIKTLVARSNDLCGVFHWPAARRALLGYQQQLNLSTKVLKASCITRWGSIKKMFKRLYDSREAIILYLAKHRNRRNPRLTDEQWQIMGDMLGALRHLNEATVELSQQKVPTIGLITPIFANLLNGLGVQRRSAGDDEADEEQQLHPAVMEFRKNVAEDLLNRWGMLKAGASKELVMSAYLDPRTKDFAFVDDKEERQRCLDEAIEHATELSESMTHGSRRMSSSETSSSEDDEEEEEEDSNSRDEPSAAQEQRQQRETKIRLYGRQAEIALRHHGEDRDCHEEIERYTQLDPCPLLVQEDKIVTSNPLSWWKEHEREYPRLAQLARRYLCISPTSVPCERVFSKGGWIVNKRRCSLSSDRASTLLFVSYNKQHKTK